MDSLIATALSARSLFDVDRLDAELVKRFGSKRSRFLGDNESNWSSVASAVDPRSVIFERVTNMWDAVIEAEAERRGRNSFATPAEAAHVLLGIPRAGLTELTGSEGRELAARCVLSLLDSDDPVRRPTIGFRDYGIGLTPAEMPETILSLERSNKLRKHYLHGIFGKGGSVACMFSGATVILTRKQPDLLADGEEDRVALAVVRQSDADDVGLPFFRYLVGPDDLPYSVLASEAPEFEPGTLVLQLGYQAEKMGQQKWEYEESIYALGETVLLRPTLPYGLHDQRQGDANMRPADRRDKPSVVMGLGQRLDATAPGDRGLMAASRPSTLAVPGVGEVTVRWWLFENQDHVRRRAAKDHVALFIANGQAHHVWNRSRFRTLVDGRRRVSDRIIVEMDTAHIPQKTRVRIFSSFRDAFLKSPEAAALEKAVAEWLGSDQDLEEAESQFTRQALRSAGGRVSAALRRRLNRALKVRVPGLRAQRRGGGDRPPPPKPPEDLHPEPTMLEGPGTLEAIPGQRKSFYLRCNAVDGFVPDIGELAITADAAVPDFSYGIGDLRRGRLHVSLLAPEESALGDYEIRAELSWMKTAGGFTTLGWPITVKLVKELSTRRGGEPKGSKDKRQPSKDGDVALIWDSPNDDNEWDEKIVGELQELKGDDLANAHPEEYGDLAGAEAKVPTIVLNEQFRDLHDYLRATAHRVGDRGVEARKDRYALAVAVTVANLSLQEQKLGRKYTAWEQAQNGRDEPPKPMEEEQLQRALAEHARGVIALLPDFDELLTDEDEAEGSVGTPSTDGAGDAAQVSAG